MKQFFRYLNVGCYLAILFYVGFVVTSAMGSGYPWVVTCYNCGLCRQSCPVGLDPYGFIAAAMANDPTTLVQAVNVKLLPHEAALLDKAMPMITVDGKRFKAGDLPGLMRERADDEVFVARMQARYAAAYCILCGNCERLCPIKLPIMGIIKDYRHGKSL